MPSGKALLLVAISLLGCHSKSKVVGAIALDEAPFTPDHCSVYEVRVPLTHKTLTSRMVTLYASSNPTTISVSEDDPTARVTLLVGGKVVEVGEQCATLIINGQPLSDPRGVTGSARIACAGAGHHVAADITFAKCSDRSMD